MATKNLVPRANKEGQLGTDAKQWNKVIAHTGSFQAVSSSLIPDATNTYDLGSETKFWRDIYVSSGSIKFIDPSDNSVASTLSVGVDGLTLSGNQSVSGSTLPDADNLYDLGSSAKQWKDLYINGTANIDTLTLTSGASVTTINDENDMSSDSDTALATQQSIKAYVDSQVTAQDLDIQGDSGGALSIDLDSETLDIAGGTGISTSGNTNTITITTTDSEIVHDNLSGFVANEHIDHSGVSITAGNGLTGGGTIASTRTIAVGAGTGVTVNSNDVSIGQDVGTTANVQFAHITGSVISGSSLLGVVGTATQGTIDHDSLANFVANEHIDHSSVSITAGDGLTGGGTIAANRTINVVGGTGITANSNDIATNDSEIVHDNLSGFVANEHIDHSGVTMTAGSGLTGGGTIASTRTFNVGAGTGVTVNANDVAIGQAVATNSNVTFGSVTVSNDVTINGDLNVLGDAVELQVSNLRIEDKLIEVASGSANSEAADGAGLLIGGANETLKWNHGSTNFQFSDDLYVSGSITLSGNVDGRDIASDGSKLDGIEASADVTDTTNVTAAGALMDSELTDLDGVKSLTVPNSTTISTFGASLVDDANASAARTTLGVDATGTDNSTLSGLTATAIGKAIVTGSNAAAVRSTIGVDTAGTDNSTNVTLSGTPNYITISGQTITRNTIDIGDDTNLSGGTGITLTGDTLSTTDSEIVHDNLSGFVANEHIDHSGVTLTAGNGLTGGGTIAASRTFAVGAGTGITVAADAVSTNDSEIVHDNLSGFVANEHIDHTSVTLTAGSGLTGGGTIASNRTFNVGAGTHITVNSNDVAVNTGTLIASISGSIVTTANVTSAGALMDSEVDADIKTLSLPASTTISTFGKSLVDDADAGTARATLGVDAAGTDNSTDVTLSGTPNYITISGQTITRNTIDIGDDTNLVAGTNITLSGDTLNVDDAFLKNNADDTTSGTLTAANFITSGKIGAATNDEYFDFGTDAMIKVGIDNVEDFRFSDGGTFHARADVIAYSSTPSDERLKDNVITIDNGLSLVNQLRGVTYDWNVGSKQGTRDIGVIAQEVEKVLPELVKENKLPLITDSDETYKTVDYEKLTAVLIEAVKELSQKVENIEKNCDCLNK